MSQRKRHRPIGMQTGRQADSETEERQADSERQRKDRYRERQK